MKNNSDLIEHQIVWACLRVLIVVVATFLLIQPNFSHAKEKASPEDIIQGIDARVLQYFEASSGEPLVRGEIQPPFGPNRGNYARDFSYSIVAYAARCFFLEESLEEANAALVENAEHYLNNPNDINDRDSFHWHADIVMRLIEMYGTNGSSKPGLLTAETEEYILKPMWIYVKKSSTLEKANSFKWKTWDIYGSENHHTMDFVLNWHFTKLAKDRPEYAGLKCKDGASIEEHYKAWNDYCIDYFIERGRKGPFIEMMNSHYNATTSRVFYNVYDFGDSTAKKAAGLYLDLIWAYWAQEQIDGLMGGGGSRIGFHEALQGNLTHGTETHAWLLFDIGDCQKIYGADINVALTTYRPLPVVVDIATDPDGRERYEVIQRAQGLGKSQRIDRESFYRMRTDGGGVLRYSYCDPSFIIGCPMALPLPLSDWAAISVQGRSQGVIFGGKDDARIIPTARPETNNLGRNGQWSVQSKGTLITQKLKDNLRMAEMLVWFSEAGLSDLVEIDGVVFAEAEGAYAAVRVVSGGFEWLKKIYTVNKIEGIVYKTRPANIMILNDEYSPVILEVMAKSDVEDFESFQKIVSSSQPVMKGPVVHYTTIYGDQLTMDTSHKKTPTINGIPINYNPDELFVSPFLQSEYNSGVISISKGNRHNVLDFNAVK